jgi:hypothetical protein
MTYHGIRSPRHWRSHLPAHLLSYRLQLPPNPQIAIDAGPRALVSLLSCSLADAEAIVTCAKWDVQYCQRTRRQKAPA